LEWWLPKRGLQATVSFALNKRECNKINEASKKQQQNNLCSSFFSSQVTTIKQQNNIFFQ